MPFSRSDLEHLAGHPWTMEIPPSCPRCGFNLSGTGGNRCPECGITYVRSVVAEFARRMQIEIRSLRNMNDHVKLGAKIAGVGIVILGLGIWRQTNTPSMGEVARLLALIIGVIAFSLGLNVFRVWRLPVWVREYIPVRPNFSLGVVTALLGVLLVVMAVLA